jgi:hypothetical protein
MIAAGSIYDLETDVRRRQMLIPFVQAFLPVPPFTIEQATEDNRVRSLCVPTQRIVPCDRRPRPDMAIGD